MKPPSATPLLAYRWKYTDHALREELALKAEGYPATVESGHAAVRYVNPTSGDAVMPSDAAGGVPPARARHADRDAPGCRLVGVQVFNREGTVEVGDHQWDVERGDLFVVPSWQGLAVESERGLDLFRFSDAPIIERLEMDRTEIEGG